MNNCTFTGHLGQDPELQVTQEGKPFTKFSMAVDQGKNKPTMWLRVTTWDKLAEIVEMYTKKGSMVAVSGRLSVRSYELPNGTKGVAVELTANTVDFMTPKGTRADELPDVPQVNTGDAFTPLTPEEEASRVTE